MEYDFLFRLPGLFVAIVIHEFSHGYIAYVLGDNTAKEAGRLTLNPLKHLDIMGLVFLLLFKFGWAKPVPINSNNFKNRKRDMIAVSLAGPFSNFLVAIVIGTILSMNIITNYLLINIFVIMLWYNLMLGIFNLLPLPPLDGSKILASLLPVKYEYLFYKNERYLYLILIILIATDTINKILSPIIDISLNLLIKIVV
ncbi:site-2 protease family protein [Schnuerera sp.]|uniref:site-2 protease family protein n=1 Tax=Schnuerera sp. TaxID=2794844 RepID=UPI002BE29FF0|nr:site-2 protease family protein [Schnuerera sp.]HSH35148.1 site-2 protease family protein [Schnuerera sp.]